MQVAVWDTSAISSLSKLDDWRNLIATMRTKHAHWIPRCVFDEIALTTCQEERGRILAACRELARCPGRIILPPRDLITAGVLIYREVGLIDWEILLETRHEIEKATVWSLLNDDLAKVYHTGPSRKLGGAEDWFGPLKPLFKTLVKSGTNDVKTLDEQVAFARSKGIFRNTVRRYCRNILRYEVDLSYAARFAEAFPPIEALICSYFVRHARRNAEPLSEWQAGAIDLLGAAYLPLCDTFVSDDRNQQTVFRDVARCCSLRTNVLWFSGDFRTQFDVLPML